LFQKLAREELTHKQALENLDLEGFSNQQCGLDWFDIIDTFRTSNYENLKRAVEIIEFAMDQEEKAKIRYQQMADEAVEPDIKKLCTDLSIAESCHLSLLRTEYERLHKKGS
jgi:rubrerythrin